jgi:hypothetical protein
MLLDNQSSSSPQGEVELSLPESVCVGIPCYREVVPIEQMTALVETVYQLRTKGVKVAIATERGNALIDMARSRLVDKFLNNTDYQKIFWLDDDIIFTPDDFERLLAWSTLYPIVAATYPVRQDPVKFFIRQETNQWDQNEYGLFKIIGTGLGFCIMDRSVFETMVPDTSTFIVEDKEIKHFFKIESENGVYFGEDIYFFKRWHDKYGGSVMLDPSIDLKHVGQNAYDYKFIDYIKGLR